MSWVDVIVIVLALIAGVSGWRHGMAVALLSFVGVLGGAILGVRLAPLLAAGIETDSNRIIVSIVIVVALVALGETTGVFFGRRIRDRITGINTLRIDSTLGSILQAITVVVAAWLVALPLASASIPGLAAGVRGSGVLRAVDAVMPAAARQLPAELKQILGPGFPDVLGSFAATPITTEVGPPDPALTGSPIVARVRDSVLKIRSTAPSCSRELEGSGFVIAPKLVMTNAHVVAGTTTNKVEVVNRQGNIEKLDAKVVLYQPDVDLAVLRVRDLQADNLRPSPPLVFAPGPSAPGDPGIVLGYPLDKSFTPTSARVRQKINLKGPNIYDNGEVTREVYTVRAVVRAGNSGGPLISPTGQVLGVVFGAAVDDQETGFVLTDAEVMRRVDLGAAQNLTAAVGTGRCAN